jgi:DNA-binding response OmpR family regulator
MTRLLLIEDDASIRRFVALALEELALEITEAQTLAEARAVLADASTPQPALVISDLMLPDGSARALVGEIAARLPVLVLSAGLRGGAEHELLALGVREVLLKPVSLARLETAVQRALAGAAPAPAPEPASAAEHAVAHHFGGDRELWSRFRSGCLERFGDDIRQGDHALAGGQAAALRRVVHSLKSVLVLIGEPALAAKATRLEAQLEALAATGPAARPGPDSAAAWAALADGLRGLR